MKTEKIMLSILAVIILGCTIAIPFIDRTPKIIKVEIQAPVLDRIAQCESGGRQYNSSGQILININSDKTYDIGYYQINSDWNETATKLGYDLTKEADNKAFGLWLYKNNGTGVWSASAKCWEK